MLVSGPFSEATTQPSRVISASAAAIIAGETPGTDSTAFSFYYGGGFARTNDALAQTSVLDPYIEPIPFPEVYSAIETGVADAAEGEPATLSTTKWYEVTKSVSLTKHIWHFRFIAVNAAKFDSLTPEHQAVLKQAAADAQAYQAGLVNDFNDKALAEMKAAGVNVVETEGLDKFAERMATFHDEYAASLGDKAVALLAKVRSVE